MSKTVELGMDCPRCKTAFTAMLYRTIWVEDPENMDLVMTDRINVVRCPACGLSEQQPFPFLATNAGKKFAVWYEPIPDRNIDADVAHYRKHFGDDYFLARAPRIKDWAEFKKHLLELNQGRSVRPTIEEFSKLNRGMRSANAEATPSPTPILFLLVGFCFGVFIQAGGGILAGAFRLTPWLTLWWGIGITVYTIVKDYWLPSGKQFGHQPHWVKAILLTIPWGIALHTGINYALYLVLHWTIHAVHG